MTDNNDDKRTPLHIEEGRTKEYETESVPMLTTLFKTWWNEAAWPGMGLFGESYLLFSIGLIKPFWEVLYPQCFTYEVCSPWLLNSLTYSVVVGVMCGMITVGYFANSMGRRMGGITTASFMCTGAIGLTFVSFIFSNNPRFLFLSMSILLFIFGVGVGGEYPISSSTATEKAMGEMKEKLKLELQREAACKFKANAVSPIVGNKNFARHLDVSGMVERKEEHRNIKRGQAVQLVFLSQGIGILLNSSCIVVLLLVFGQYGSLVEGGNYRAEALLSIWQIVYSIGAIVLTVVLVTRLYCLKESPVWADDKERRDKLDRVAPQCCDINMNPIDPPQAQCSSTVSDLTDPSSVLVRNVSSVTEKGLIKAVDDDVYATPFHLLLKYFGWRILGSSITWFLWDIAFYGNKLFQSTFLLALSGEETSLLQLSVAAALNAFVALLGYIGAALLLDNPMIGRSKLQQYGFLVTGALFVGCGFLYDKLSSGWLVLMYFASSFVGQLGPNATTFLIPSEIFPTEMRTQCHGVAAASGKFGALLAAVAFNYIDTVDLFLFSGYASIAACLVTFWTIPDVTTLDLYEIDRQWWMTLEGRRAEYIGDANKAKHLSYYERTKLGTY